MKIQSRFFILLSVLILLFQFCDDPQKDEGDDGVGNGAGTGDYPRPKTSMDFDYLPTLNQTANVEVQFWFESPVLDSLAFYSVDTVGMVSVYGNNQQDAFSYSFGDTLWHDQISIYDTSSFIFPITPDTVGIQRLEVVLYSEKYADSTMHNNYWGRIIAIVYQRIMVQPDTSYTIEGY